MADYLNITIMELQRKLKEAKDAYNGICDLKELEGKRYSDVIRNLRKENADLAHENDFLKVRNAQLERALKDALFTPIPTPAPAQPTHIAPYVTKVVKEPKATLHIGVVEVSYSYMADAGISQLVASFLQNEISQYFKNLCEIETELIGIEFLKDGNLKEVPQFGQFDIVCVLEDSEELTVSRSLGKYLYNDAQTYPIVVVRDAKASRFSQPQTEVLRLFADQEWKDANYLYVHYVIQEMNDVNKHIFLGLGETLRKIQRGEI